MRCGSAKSIKGVVGSGCDIDARISGLSVDTTIRDGANHCVKLTATRPNALFVRPLHAVSRAGTPRAQASTYMYAWNQRLLKMRSGSPIICVATMQQHAVVKYVTKNDRRSSARTEPTLLFRESPRSPGSATAGRRGGGGCMVGLASTTTRVCGPRGPLLRVFSLHVTLAAAGQR